MKKPFCIAPWTTINISSTGKIRPCCYVKNFSFGSIYNGDTISSVWNDTSTINFREKMFDDIPPVECIRCVNSEKELGSSRRTFYNDYFTKKFLSGIHIDYNTTCSLDTLKHIDLSLGNMCTLQCKMCGSWGSNKWYSDDKILGDEFDRIVHKPTCHTINQFNDIFDKNLKYTGIDFKGGEPFIHPEHNLILTKLIETGRSNEISLHYMTNGTRIDFKCIELLTKFKNVKLSFSIEGSGKLYQYIRGGTDNTFDQIISNAKRVKSISDKIDVNFSCTLMIYNMFNINTLVNTLAEEGFRVALDNVVENPKYLSPFIAPQELRVNAADQITIPYLQVFKNSLINIPDTLDSKILFEKCKAFTRYFDTKNKTSLKEIVPEFKGYL